MGPKMFKNHYWVEISQKSKNHHHWAKNSKIIVGPKNNPNNHWS